MWPQYQRAISGSRSGAPVNHVLITGQSLGVGMLGSPALSQVTHAQHLMFPNVLLDAPPTTLPSPEDLNLIGGLREGLDPQGLETIASGFGAYVAANVPGHRLLMSNWAKYGTAYAGLKRSPATGSPNTMATGTAPYLRGLAQVMAGWQVFGARHRVRALLVVHGEGDITSATYDTDIRQWQLDCETDYLALTGQTGRIPMFHSQPSSWSSTVLGSRTTGVSPFLLYNEHKANPTKTTLVCPKYIFPYAADGGHLVNTSYRWLGQYYGKAYVRQVVNGTQWDPLRPSGVARVGNVITVTFTGNVGQLVLDNGRVSNPGNFGFEYTDDTSPPAIAQVAITGINTVAVTLASAPGGANKKLRYAYTGVGGNPGGPMTGPRGCLRDSDTARGVNGEELFNWCVHFEEVVT